MTQKSVVNGYIRAIADQTHPLQTKLSLILTDFNPNGNHQGVPRSEIDNIIRTAQYMPLKINFNGSSYAGHTGALPIGPIINVYEGQDNDRDVLFGEAIIWNQVYKDVADHLKAAFSEGVGTSWEIFYEDATVDDNGVEWLNGCVFAGTCVVEVPAYGPNRTRVLAIAEALNERADTLKTMEIEMSKDQEAQSAGNTVDMDATRNDLVEVQDVLFKLWEGVDSLFNKTFEIEAAQVENDIGKIAQQFAEKLTKLANRINELETSKAELETTKAELETLKQASAEIAKAQLTKERTDKLSAAGIDVTDTTRVDRYVAMDESVFESIISDLLSIRPKTSNAEQTKQIVPEPLGKSEMTADEITKALKEEFKKN